MNAICTAVATSAGRDGEDDPGNGHAMPPVDGGDTVGSLVRLHRHVAGLTQEELAESAALSVRTVRNLEHDKVRRPRRSTLRRLAAALRLDTADSARLLATGRPAESMGRLETRVISDSSGHVLSRLEPVLTEFIAQRGPEKVFAVRVCLVSTPAALLPAAPLPPGLWSGKR